MKLLIKQAIRMIFSSKIFTIILMIIVIISSLTYTLLQSASNSFQNSYNNVAISGKLHDAVINPYFNNQGTFALTIEAKDVANSIYTIKIDETKSLTGDYREYFSSQTRPKSWDIILEVNSKQDNLETLKNEAIRTKREEIEYEVNHLKPQHFQTGITKLYDQYLNINYTQSVAVFKEPQAFKIVHKSDRTINDIVIYDGWSRFTKHLTNKQMMDELKSRAEDKFGQDTPYIINTLKGYRYTAQTFVGAVSVTDPSAFQAIISPSFANFNNKRAISPQTVLDLYTEHDNFEDIHDNPEWLTKYYDHLIWVDNTPYFVIGIGTSPDFSFPIIDTSKPIPITDKEAIVYTNIRGYERILDGFRTNPQENYFSIKFKNGVNTTKQTQILQEIETLARNGQIDPYIPRMSWPNDIKIVTRYNDINSNNAILTQQRIAFLENLKNTINILTLTTTSFLIIFVAAIMLLIFKSLLSIRRQRNATLMALGFTKNKIGFSIALATILLVGLPSIIGYIFGYFLQFSFINIFATYWTIPTYGSTFSIISLIITVVIPLLASFIMIFILTYWDLNEQITLMLRNKSKYKFSLAKLILRPLSWTNIKVKYVASLTINNIGRLILSTLAGIVSVSAIAVGISSIGKAEYAYNETIGKTNYTFQVNYTSPTENGGQYQTITYDQAIAKLDQAIKKLEKNETVDKNTIHWHIPNIGDANLAVPDFITMNITSTKEEKKQRDYLNDVRTFLKNKLQFKPLIDVTIAEINSWNIAKKLMPENQRNIAENNELKLYELITKTQVNQHFNKKPWWPLATNKYKIDPSTKMINDQLDPDFIKFIKNGLLDLKNQNSDFKPYIITYGTIMLYDENINEKYTYVQTNLNDKAHNIIGIKSNSQYINISNATQLKLQTIQEVDNERIYPLVINNFMAEKYKLAIDQILNLKINNHVQRYNRHQKDKAKWQIVEIINSYDDDRLITHQKWANEILGLKLEDFNGIFTQEKTPLILETLPLYSPTDFYIGTDTITDKWSDIVQKILETNAHNLPNINTVQELITKYSATPYVATFQKIAWNEANKSTFLNISKLASGIIWIIQVISIVLSILFAIIVSWLLVSANNKKIATLWTLGYRKTEIMRMFTLIYILPITFSLLFGLPIAIGILNALRMFVINFGSILIPFAISLWAIILSILFIGSIFILSTILSIKNIKNEEARKIIKE